MFECLRVPSSNEINCYERLAAGVGTIRCEATRGEIVESFPAMKKEGAYRNGEGEQGLPSDPESSVTFILFFYPPADEEK